jgi:hypothetical protein
VKPINQEALDEPHTIKEKAAVAAVERLASPARRNQQPGGILG